MMGEDGLGGYGTVFKNESSELDTYLNEENIGISIYKMLSDIRFLGRVLLGSTSETIMAELKNNCYSLKEMEIFLQWMY